MENALLHAVEHVRKQSPLVHCLTNTVVQTLTANVLMAVGAAPAMVEMPGEAGVLAQGADAVLINLGTINEPQIAGIREAAASANQHGTPWVLDPVAIGSLPVRTQLAQELLEHRPTVIRGNASEILALAGGAGGRGVDSTAEVSDAEPAARRLAADLACVVAVSGAVDYITDGERELRCSNGSPLLTKVTGSGCSLGAVIGAFCAAHPDGLSAVAAAHGLVGVAAELAAETSRGPGSFQAAWLDALYTLDTATLAERLRVR